MKILTEATPLALWYEALHSAQERSQISLKAELESYLVFLLSRYTTQPELIKEVIALKFLEAMKLQQEERFAALQAVGDKCLLITGLFPTMAEKRRLKLSYFVDLGRCAYEGRSERTNDLYTQLAKHFVTMMDVLQSFDHSTPHLLPHQAYALWEETGSQRALQILQAYQLFPLSSKNPSRS